MREAQESRYPRVFILTSSVPFIVDKTTTAEVVGSLSFPCCCFTMWYKANCNVSSFHWTHFCTVNLGQSKHHKISTLKLRWILEVASAHTWLMNTPCPPKLISNHDSFPTSGDGIAILYPDIPSMFIQLWKAVIPNVDISACLLICSSFSSQSFMENLLWNLQALQKVLS